MSKYLDCPNEALFPFGYGLSYHTASYSGLTLDRDILRPGETLRAVITVENTGDVAGTETVQLYIRDLVGSVARPVLELKGWQQVTLLPGERKEVVFEITEDMLRFYTKDMTFSSEPGNFEVYVGPNSRDLQKAGFTLTEDTI